VWENGRGRRKGHERGEKNNMIIIDLETRKGR